MSKYIYLSEVSGRECYQVLVPYVDALGRRRRKGGWFSIAKWGEEEALRRAVARRDALVRELHGEISLKMLYLPLQNASHLVKRNSVMDTAGVCFSPRGFSDKHSPGWVASGQLFNPDAPTKYFQGHIFFSAGKYGMETAKALAIRARDLIRERYLEDASSFFQGPEGFSSPGKKAILAEIREKALLLLDREGDSVTPRGIPSDIPSDFSTLHPNSSKYVHFYPSIGSTGGFKVDIPVKGSRKRKRTGRCFSFDAYGGEEKALAAAKRYRDYLGSSMYGLEVWGRKMDSLASRETSCTRKVGSPLPGVYPFLKEKRGRKVRFWAASFLIFDPAAPKLYRKKTRVFSVNKHGEEEAKRLAIEVRTKAVEEFYKARVEFLDNSRQKG